MRLLHKIYAMIFGYYWLPCIKCGKMFGGHEKHGEIVWESGRRCCYQCRDVEIMNEEKNGIHRFPEIS